MFSLKKIVTNIPPWINVKEPSRTRVDRSVSQIELDNLKKSELHLEMCTDPLLIWFSIKRILLSKYCMICTSPLHLILYHFFRPTTFFQTGDIFSDPRHTNARRIDTLLRKLLLLDQLIESLLLAGWYKGERGRLLNFWFFSNPLPPGRY